MSGLFRSETMSYVRIIMSDDAAYDTVRELGKFERLHIIDLGEQAALAGAAASASASSGAAESSYTYYKKRVALCQFWERKFLSFRDACDQYGVVIPDLLNPLEVVVDDIRSADMVEDCRAFIEPIEASLAKNVVFRKELKQTINQYVEYTHVLDKNADNQFGNAHAQDMPMQSASHGFSRVYDDEEKGGFGQAAQPHGASFTSTICGVIAEDKMIAFERLLFRVSRGNAFCKFYEIGEKIEDPQTGELETKQVFAITFMGEQLARRISRIIQHAGATEYAVPASRHEIERLRGDIGNKLADSLAILARTDAEVRDLLASLAVDPTTRHAMPYTSPYLNWLTALQKERRICDTMKKCDQDGPNSKVLTMEGWCPTEYVEDLRFVLGQAVRVSGAKEAALQVFAKPPGGKTPPTYFKTNAFTSSYQGIVDTYGVPRYKEVNPGLFTIISFPFLFGIMYGDIGHGTLLFLFACYLLFNEKKFLDKERRGQLGEIPQMVFGGRYLLVLMGAFALYAGTIYNDCFSNPVHAIQSRWNLAETGSSNHTHMIHSNLTDLDTYEGPYPYGVDPAWYHTTNELAFFNSMKMKLAVTLGVTQMTFGICLGALNDLHSKDYLALFFEFIPRLIFILCTFGYMVFIIIFKMCVNWGPDDTPPLLIQTMIQMFLSPGSVTKENQLYEGQGTIQAILVLAAVFSVPFMLFPIPCITNVRNKAYMKKKAARGLDDDDGEALRSRLDSRASPPPPQEGRELKRMRFDANHRASPSDIGLGEASAAGRKQQISERLLNAEESSSYVVHSASVVGHTVQVIDDRGVDVDSRIAVDAHDDGEDHEEGGHGEHALGEDYAFGDHMIVQGIHTIEFVLGTVSNTASYLRLWALSLAHAELSAVFWDKMIMQYGINGSYGALSVVIGFAVWAVATFAVLLAMDVLECFLHALRLHWVEFQNKFFHADGYAFEPFTFAGLSSEKA